MALALSRRAAQDARNAGEHRCSVLALKFAVTGRIMTSDIGIRRRTFLGGVAALGAMHGFGIDAAGGDLAVGRQSAGARPCP